MPKLTKNYKINTPHCAAIIWNYRDRIGGEGAPSNIDIIDQKIISTLSLINVKTSKSKSQVAGSFEMILAPTKDWVATITPGSWMCILMSQEKIEKKHLEKADPNYVKFFGRVESVRADVSVDQETGARRTVYSVVGTDWANIFNYIVYVDPSSRFRDPAVGLAAATLLYNDYSTQIVNDIGLPSSTQNVRLLLNLWGKSNSLTFQNLNSKAAEFGGIVKPDIVFKFPKEVSNFFGFASDAKSKLTNIADVINLHTGVLSSYDKYAEVLDSVGIIRPESILGAHSLWQLMTDNCNEVLNELIADIRWEKSKPTLSLYKRIRPFAIRDIKEIATKTNSDPGAPEQGYIGGLLSKYENVKRIKIPLENILSFNAGTNWRDKYNYIEMQIDQSSNDPIKNIEVKIKAPIFDEKAFAREGFKPMIVPTKYLPATASKGYDPLNVYQWKYLLKEWYFDTHTMLNGAITFMGIPEYIQVGDNIIIDAEVMGPSNNVNNANIKNKNKSFILAHVENISHNFSVNEEGARTFMTSIQFVRGIITDSKGRQFGKKGSGRVDVDVTKLNNEDKRNVNVISTSSENDPDIKLNGS